VPRFLILPVLLVVVGLVLFWASGGFDHLAALAAMEQRDFQTQIARQLRALRGGETGALALLLLACFLYGFFHAVGPGHGKVLIGGYGLGRDIPWLRLVWISLASSIGQAVTAVALVYAGVWALHLTREHMIGAAENIMAPMSYGAIALIGLWLILRGARHAARATAGEDHGLHHHDHGEHCDHRHGPTLDEVAETSTLRETLLLIGGIAMRPCTGAIFVLLITWQMGIGLAGIAGAAAMAIGTAAVTIAVALTAVGLRGGLVGAISQSRLAARVVPMIEVAAGLSILVIALGLLMRALG